MRKVNINFSIKLILNKWDRSNSNNSPFELNFKKLSLSSTYEQALSETKFNSKKEQQNKQKESSPEQKREIQLCFEKSQCDMFVNICYKKKNDASITEKENQEKLALIISIKINLSLLFN
jgi:hypothetical protein